MKDSKMPNSGKGSKSSDTDSGSKGSNHGATGSLKSAPAGGAPGKVGDIKTLTLEPFDQHPEVHSDWVQLLEEYGIAGLPGTQ